MILILSDIHFGKADASAERAKEADVVSLLRHYQSEITQLYLLGDVFDHFIEYRHSIPKGFSRFLGTLADLSDSGIDLTYFLGNHDPWHKDYFTTEFGASIVTDGRIEDHGQHRVYLTHGDGKAGKRGVYKSLRPILRHRVPTTLYRYVLPGDTGIGLARWSSRRFSAKETNMRTVSLMRDFAAGVLKDPVDIVIMGHCHHAELTDMSDGIYLNTGSWHDDRTFGILTGDEIRLLSWKSGNESTINTIPLAQNR